MISINDCKLDRNFDTEFDPMSLGYSWQDINSIINKQRRIAWVIAADLSEYMIRKANRCDYLNWLQIYDKESKTFNNRVRRYGINFVKSEHMIFISGYEKQAQAAKEELLRRDGYWTLTFPEADINMARLMGYGESYIIKYIEKHYPEFNINNYIGRYEYLSLINA